MARGSTRATNAADAASSLSGNLEGKAAQGFGFLMPELQAEATNPQGFGPQAMAQMNTEAQQGAGGTQAAAEGKGALLASRLKNPGAARAAVAQSSRGAGEQLSQDQLNIQNRNALLKEKQRENALGGIENLTGLNTGAGIQSAGQIAPDVNASTNASRNQLDWTQSILGDIFKVAGMVPGIPK